MPQHAQKCLAFASCHSALAELSAQFVVQAQRNSWQLSQCSLNTGPHLNSFRWQLCCRAVLTRAALNCRLHSQFPNRILDTRDWRLVLLQSAYTLWSCQVCSQLCWLLGFGRSAGLGSGSAYIALVRLLPTISDTATYPSVSLPSRALGFCSRCPVSNCTISFLTSTAPSTHHLSLSGHHKSSVLNVQPTTALPQPVQHCQSLTCHHLFTSDLLLCLSARFCSQPLA
jgi:hypothetical protein